ncbi:hypothetical protein HDZ31DRAFT_37978 [Schizophyllum fasciatum]
MTFFRTVRLVVDDAEYDFPLPEVGSGEVPRPKKDGKIPRPPNQWIVWRAAFMKACLSYGKMLPGGLCTHAHMIWEGLSREEKQLWAGEAKRIAEEHRRLYPDYKFHPVHDPAKRKARAQKKFAAAHRSTSPEDETMDTPTPDGASSQYSRLSSPAQYTRPTDASHVTYGPGSLSPASILAGGPAIRLPNPERLRAEQTRGVKEETEAARERAMPTFVLSPRWYDARGDICPPALHLDPRDRRQTHSHTLPPIVAFPPRSAPAQHGAGDGSIAPIAKVRRTATTFEDSRRTATGSWPASAAQWPIARQAHDGPAAAVASFPACGKKRVRCPSMTAPPNFRGFRRTSLCEK